MNEAMSVEVKRTFTLGRRLLEVNPEEWKKDTGKRGDKQPGPFLHFGHRLGIFCIMIRPLPLIAVVACAAFLAGCLTVESKEYHIKLRSDFSGEATIRFVNILSESEDTLDITSDDFKQLTEFYLEGTQLEKDNPGFKNVRKRLYEQNGVLMGEVSFSFDSIAAVRIFRYDRSSPFMYFVGSPLSAEQLVETNGTRGPDWMPVVFWNRENTEFYVKTKVVSEVSYQRSLVKRFQEWQAAQVPGKQ